MNKYTYIELFEYLHKDDKDNFIMSFDNLYDCIRMITKFTIHSIYDIKKLDYMTNLQELIIDCPLTKEKIKNIIEHPNVAKIISFEYINKNTKECPDIDVSKFTNLIHLKSDINIRGYCKLKNLITLELDWCDLEDISNLTLLKKLIVSFDVYHKCKILDASKMSGLEYLEIGYIDKLTLNILGCNKLNCLKLFNTNCKIICDGILPNLRELSLLSRHRTSFLNNKFPELRKIEIHQGKFDASIVYKFSKLRELNLKYSSIQHKIMGHDILDVSHFPELNTLKISPKHDYYGIIDDNRMTIIGMENIQNIEKLNICGVKKINISNLTNLRKLKYSYCNEIIGLNKIHNLHTLSCDAMPENISNHLNLNKLKIWCQPQHHIKNSGKNVTIDFNKMTNTNLTSICIKVCCFCETKYKIIGIRRFEKLQELYICCDDFDIDDIIYLKCLRKLSIMLVSKTHHPNLDISNLRELKCIELIEDDIDSITGISNSVTNLTIDNTKIKELNVTNLNLETCELNSNMHCILKGLENSKYLRKLILYCVNITINKNKFNEIFPRLDELTLFACNSNEETYTLDSKIIRRLKRDGIFYDDTI